MSQNDNMPPVPLAFEYVYEWADGARKLNTSQRNGMKCKASYLVYTADQMQDYARAAIAAQAVGQGEPLGWIDAQDVELIQQKGRGGIVFRTKQEGYDQTQVYTHPAPVRQPLSDDELDLICEQALFGRISYQQLARSIEATHGITAQGGT